MAASTNGWLAEVDPAPHPLHCPAPALTVGPALASAGVFVAADDLKREVAIRAPAFAAAAQAACNAPVLVELEHEIRRMHAAASRAGVSDATASATAPMLAAPAGRIGDLDTVPAVSLQMLRSPPVHGAGDTARVIEGRAFAVALAASDRRQRRRRDARPPSAPDTHSYRRCRVRATSRDRPCCAWAIVTTTR
ncbi:hypothetical protein [Luteimonas deserti]|uniref:Uncharacterized protein n=1 Tax=Luteimonas deserti TaxID=2752306 RepID=A0A7Z0TYQ4_9GAMM|nr:hypothetical protein [Luteimonas deserti]NYZ62617.1 hypothetical protein [Luteimonas deserti]